VGNHEDRRRQETRFGAGPARHRLTAAIGALTIALAGRVVGRAAD
jgi:hypothetical protein